MVARGGSLSIYLFQINYFTNFDSYFIFLGLLLLRSSSSAPVRWKNLQADPAKAPIGNTFESVEDVAELVAEGNSAKNVSRDVPPTISLTAGYKLYYH